MAGPPENLWNASLPGRRQRSWDKGGGGGVGEVLSAFHTPSFAQQFC